LLLAKKTTAAGVGRKKAVDLDSSSDFEFGASKPKKQLMPKAAPKVKATKPKATKAPKKMAVSSDIDSSDEESSGKKKGALAAVCTACLLLCDIQLFIFFEVMALVIFSLSCWAHVATSYNFYFIVCL